VRQALRREDWRVDITSTFLEMDRQCSRKNGSTLETLVEIDTGNECSGKRRNQNAAEGLLLDCTYCVSYLYMPVKFWDMYFISMCISLQILS